MVDPMLTILPMAKTFHIGMYNNRNSLLPVCYYNRLPAKCEVDLVIILEPQIGSGTTVSATIDLLKEWNEPNLRIKVVSIIASRQGCIHVLQQHPDIELIVVGIDDTFDEKTGDIIPGLGDVGDRLYNTYEVDHHLLSKASLEEQSSTLYEGDDGEANPIVERNGKHQKTKKRQKLKR